MLIDAKSAALVLIDLQKGVLGMQVAPHPAAQIYKRSRRFADGFRTAGGLVVHVRVSFAPDAADALHNPVDQPTDYSALAPGWDEFPEPPPASDLVIVKRQWGAFYGTDLDLQLRRRARRSIVLGGIATNIGVESTARNAAELGYSLVIPEDLCACRTAESHAFSFRNVFPRIARVTTSDRITFG